MNHPSILELALYPKPFVSAYSPLMGPSNPLLSPRSRQGSLAGNIAPQDLGLSSVGSDPAVTQFRV